MRHASSYQGIEVPNDLVGSVSSTKTRNSGCGSELCAIIVIFILKSPHQGLLLFGGVVERFVLAPTVACGLWLLGGSRAGGGGGEWT